MTPRQIAIATLSPICFGMGFTIAKPAVAHFPPLFMMLLVYGAIALYFLVVRRTRVHTPWASIMLIASCAVTIQGALLFGALQELTATTTSLVLQMQVPFAVILGWIMLGESFDWRKTLGTLVALLGVVMVIGLPEVKPPFWPVTVVIASGFVWALGQALARRLGKDSGMGLLQANSYGAVPQLLLATVLLETGQLQSLMTATPLHWAMLAFVAIVGFYLAYVSFYSVLSECRMDEVAPFILLMPLISVLTAWALLGETISLAQAAGGLVIMAGLGVITGLDRLLTAAGSDRAAAGR